MNGIKLFGGMLSYFIPGKIINEAKNDESVGPVYLAYFFASVVILYLGWQLDAIMKELPIDSLPKVLFGNVVFSAVSLLILFFYTNMWKKVLNGSKVKGEMLHVEFAPLWRCHLYVYPIFISLLNVGYVTGNPIILILLALSAVRTIHVQVIVVSELCQISFAEALKGTLLIITLFGGLAALIAWLINKIF